ncbi:hypothetical protein G7Y89_g120 [Cudoniella acicularis]|uniref:Uncharacterized protein n=1 Tax=Cudoniella acicularis TaxID=354080 RepID=A0A8H4RYP5_9HELO|nr:hypothetical protein G7Y89_g120 [Cudoniella acicularis]
MGWFQDQRDEGSGWRLDIVSLLAVIGESSMEEHVQAMTSSWTCLLPRIIPAPQALLKPSRPTRMPQLPSAVVGIRTLENAEPTQLQQRQSTMHRIQQTLTLNKDPKPHIPTETFSPLNVLSVFSCVVTIGLFIWAALIKDGTACVALGTISLVSSIVGYASWWSPVLKRRVFHSKVPDGDVAIRTREGAFLIVKCNENVARELYTGTEECQYYAGTKAYRVLVGLGTFLLMVSVVLLGNCNFPMQAAIGTSYIVLNGAFWTASLVTQDKFWNLSIYEWNDITPKDAQHAHLSSSATTEGSASFTRTMWYAIRETKKIGWLKKMGAAPTTPEWDEWLNSAEANAVKGNRGWKAVEQREQMVGLVDNTATRDESSLPMASAEQHVPAFEVPSPATR